MSVNIYNVDGQHCVSTGILPEGYTIDNNLILNVDGKVVGVSGCCPVGPVGEKGPLGRNDVGNGT